MPHEWEQAIVAFLTTLFHSMDWTGVVIIMALASTRPIVEIAESTLQLIARIGGATTGAWWFTILTVAPMLGSLITEPGAMTIAALLLARHFFDRAPTPRLKYATLGLLFVNVSIGGTLTHFAAPPVLMVEDAGDGASSCANEFHALQSGQRLLASSGHRPSAKLEPQGRQLTPQLRGSHRPHRAGVRAYRRVARQKRRLSNPR